MGAAIELPPKIARPNLATLGWARLKKGYFVKIRDIATVLIELLNVIIGVRIKRFEFEDNRWRGDNARGATKHGPPVVRKVPGQKFFLLQ